MRGKGWLFLPVTALLWLAGCAKQAPDGPGMPVSVSIPPQAWLVRGIGGEKVQVQVVVPPYTDPHEYDPTPQELVRLARARVYVKVNLPGYAFEERQIGPVLAAHPEIVVVDSSRGIRLRTVEEAEILPTHKHEAEEPEGSDQHEHMGGPDPHVWTSPGNMRIMARNVCEGLEAASPADAGYFRGNLEAVIREIDAVDREISETLGEYRGGYFMDYHPSWGYFADAYGLHQIAIEVEGKEPGPADLERAIRTGRQKGIGVILVQKGVDPRGAKVVAQAIGAEVLEVDPMAPDWSANMREVSGAFRRALRKTP